MQKYLSAYYHLHSSRQINVTLISRAYQSSSCNMLQASRLYMGTVRSGPEPVIEHLVQECSLLGAQVKAIQ